MRKFIFTFPIVFQITIAFLTLYFVFELFFITRTNYSAGIVAGLGFEKSKTVFTIIIIILTIGICFFAGLPIRLIPAVHKWWINKPLIDILVFSIGIFLVLVLPNIFSIKKINSIASNDVNQVQTIFLYCILIGWFLLTFSLIHCYPTMFKKWSNIHSFE